MNSKRITVPVLLLLGIWGLVSLGEQTIAQCTPDLGCTTDLCPAEGAGLPDGTVGVAYSEVITTVIPADTSGISIDSIVLVSVDSLPPGLTYTCTPSSCGWPGNSIGCFTISGTPTDSGSYNIVLNFMVYLVFPFGTTPYSVNYNSITINSGVPPLTFQKVFGASGSDDFALSVQQTTDGGYVMAGFTTSFGAGGTDVYVVKTNANGDTLWTKTYGGSGDDKATEIQQTTDGGYIITGTTTFGAGQDDVYLIKTDGNGSTIWTKTYGGTDYESGASVKQTLDGGYVVTGSTSSYGAGGSDVYLIKTTANGDTLFTKTYGGTSSDIGSSVDQTADAGYIITGYTSSFGSGFSIYLIKTNSSGNLVWTKTYGGVGFDQGNSVQQTADGGYIVAGKTQSLGPGTTALHLIKTDNNGNISWSNTYGGTGFEYEGSVRQTTDGGYILSGRTSSFGAGMYDAFLVKTDANGDSLWTRSYGGSDWEALSLDTPIASGQVQQLLRASI